MPNYLKMPKQQQVTALLALDWSYRRIEAETGVRRETVSRYDRRAKANAAKVFPGSDGADPPVPEGEGADAAANAAKVFAGSAPNAAKVFPGSTALGPPRSRCTAAAYRTAITEKCDAGLSVQRIWQDLVEEYGYGASYESVKRFIRTLPSSPRRAVGVYHCAPGADYGKRRVMLSIRKRAGMLRRLLVGCRDGRLHIILRAPRATRVGPWAAGCASGQRMSVCRPESRRPVSSPYRFGRRPRWTSRWHGRGCV